jgi:hypothetical protein
MTAIPPTIPAKERLDAAASAALNVERCKFPELFLPMFAATRLRVHPTTNEIVVVDDFGEVRNGVTPLMAARELRKQYDAQAPGKFFEP